MGIIDTLKSFFDSLDEIFEKDLAELNSFENIDRLDELIELLISLDKNETFNKIAKVDYLGDNSMAFDYDIAKIPLHHGAQVGLGFTNYIPIYIPSVTKKIVDLNDIICTMSMIQFSFMYDSGHQLTAEDDKIINYPISFIC